MLKEGKQATVCCADLMTCKFTGEPQFVDCPAQVIIVSVKVFVMFYYIAIKEACVGDYSSNASK